MPEVFTDLSPKQQGSSLGDIVNLARGIQAYQQAQQQYNADQARNLQAQQANVDSYWPCSECRTVHQYSTRSIILSRGHV